MGTLKLLAAFFGGVASFVLAREWEKANKAEVYPAVCIKVLCIFSFALFVVSVIGVLPFVSVSYESLSGVANTCRIILAVVAVVFGIIFLVSLITYLRGFRRADRKFLKDCRILSGYMNASGVNLSDLKATAVASLVSLAVSLIDVETEAGRISPSADFGRKKFKMAHAVMVRFGLVNRDQKIYFAEAQGEIARKKANLPS